MSRTSLPTTTYPPQERGPGHVTDFWILGSRRISVIVVATVLGLEIRYVDGVQDHKLHSWAHGRFCNFGPLLISGTGKAKNLKFGVWTEYVTYWPAYDKSPSKGAWPAWRTAEVGTSNCVCDWTTWGTNFRAINYPPQRGVAGLSGGFEMLGPSPSLKRVKLGTEHLVCGWSVLRTSLPTTNYHQRERGPCHVTDVEILGPLPYLWNGWSYGLEICKLDGVREVGSCGRQMSPQNWRH